MTESHLQPAGLSARINPRFHHLIQGYNQKSPNWIGENHLNTSPWSDTQNFSCRFSVASPNNHARCVHSNPTRSGFCIHPTLTRNPLPQVLFSFSLRSPLSSLCAPRLQSHRTVWHYFCQKFSFRAFEATCVAKRKVFSCRLPKRPNRAGPLPGDSAAWWATLRVLVAFRSLSGCSLGKLRHAFSVVLSLRFAAPKHSTASALKVNLKFLRYHDLIGFIAAQLQGSWTGTCQQRAGAVYGTSNTVCLPGAATATCTFFEPDWRFARYSKTSAT